MKLPNGANGAFSAQDPVHLPTLPRLVATLTVTERSALEAMAVGLRRKEIARRLNRSEHTVNHVLTMAKEKLQAGSLAHAAVLLQAHKHGRADQPGERRPRGQIESTGKGNTT